MATTKIPFRTLLSEPAVTVTPSGEMEEEVIAMRLDEYGNEEFYVAGKTNVYEKIQSYLEETKIENILAKCIDTGDTSILDQVRGQYMDATEFPTNIMEAHNMIQRAEETFNNLPVEIRKEYDFNFNKYLNDFGSENWVNVMGFNKTEEVTVETEEKKGEEKEE